MSLKHRMAAQTAEEFVKYDDRGGVSVNLAEYLATTTGQQQLKSLGELRTDPNTLPELETENEL